MLYSVHSTNVLRTQRYNRQRRGPTQTKFDILGRYAQHLEPAKRIQFEAVVKNARQVKYGHTNGAESQEPVPVVRLTNYNTPTAIPEVDLAMLSKAGYDVDNEARLGSGAFGVVLKGVANSKARRTNLSEWADDNALKSLEGRDVAVKFTLTDRNAESLAEAHFLTNLRHANIIEVYATLRAANRLYIVMEYSPYGSLSQFFAQIQAGVDMLSEWMCRDFIQQLSAGLLYLHDQLIVHGDIHDRNVMLFRSGELYVCDEIEVVLKYVDFGSTQLFSATTLADDIALLGSLFWRLAQHTRFESRQFRIDLYRAITRLQGFDSGQALSSLRDAIREFEFLHPLEHLRLVYSSRAVLPASYVRRTHAFPQWFFAKQGVPPLLGRDRKTNIENILNNLELNRLNVRNTGRRMTSVALSPLKSSNLDVLFLLSFVGFFMILLYLYVKYLLL